MLLRVILQMKLIRTVLQFTNTILYTCPTSTQHAFRYPSSPSIPHLPTPSLQMSTSKTKIRRGFSRPAWLPREATHFSQHDLVQKSPQTPPVGSSSHVIHLWHFCWIEEQMIDTTSSKTLICLFCQNHTTVASSLNYTAAIISFSTILLVSYRESRSLIG